MVITAFHMLRVGKMIDIHRELNIETSVENFLCSIIVHTVGMHLSTREMIVLVENNSIDFGQIESQKGQF
jgi:hypothetical protein